MAPMGQGWPPPQFAQPMTLTPGVIPLRPLTLSDLYNGAVAYIRANPKATLGLTTVVVIASQAVALLLQIGPMRHLSSLDPAETDFSAAFFAGAWSELPGALISLFAATVVTGMLTVVIGRAILGTSITVGETWQRIKGRLLPLFGVTILVLLAYLGIFVGVVMITAIFVAAVGGIGGVLVGIPLGLAAVVGAVWFGTVTLFAPAAVVLERRGVLSAFSRSFALVRGGFWRTLGIWLLTAVVTYFIAIAVAFPFTLAGLFADGLLTESSSSPVLALLLYTIGTIIAEIITTPITAGVTVLLYTDRRIRSEAFDLALRTGAMTNPADPGSTDHLWLTGTESRAYR